MQGQGSRVGRWAVGRLGVGAGGCSGGITAFTNGLHPKHPRFCFRYNFVHIRNHFLLDKFNVHMSFITDK